jgi:hypothetical protein
MKANSIKLNSLVLNVISLCAVGIVVFARPVNAVKLVSLDKLKLKNQLQGWTEEKGSFQAFDADGLFKLIDGGAPIYVDNGMKKGILQRFSGPDSATIETYMEDFGSDKKARNMTLTQKSNFSDASFEANADSSAMVLWREVLGGWWVSGSMGNFYFELTITGAKDGQKGKAEARKFIDFYGKTIGIAK